MTVTLLDLLDQSAVAEREAIYVTAVADALSIEDLIAALKARRPCATWVMNRFLSGPPGTALPEHHEAFDRILKGESDTADAYVVLYAGPPLPLHPEITGVIQNAALGALRSRITYFSASLAGMAAVACLIHGEVGMVDAWLQVDAELKMPSFELLTWMTPLIARPELAREGWVRRASWAQWPSYAPPGVPALPIPEVAENGLDREALLEAIEEIGDEALTEWVGSGLRTWDARVADSLEESAEVRAIREAVLLGNEAPPDLPPPDGLLEWVRTAHVRKQHAAARLGARLLLDAGHTNPNLWTPIALDIRPIDLAFLAAIAPTDLRGSFAEAAEAAALAPPHLRGPLAVITVPPHPRFMRAADILQRELDALRHLVRPGQSWLPNVIEGLEAAPTLRTGGPNPALLATVASVRQAIGPLASASLNALRRAVEDATPLEFERNRSGLEALTSEERLIGALLLRRDSTDTAAVDCAHVAAEAIWELLHRHLFPLRIELLKAVISNPPDLVTLAWAMMALANTRNATASGDLDGLRKNAALFRRAARVAREAGDTATYVDAVVGAARTLTFGLLDEPGSDPLRAEALRDLDEALRYPVEPGPRASALWAKADIFLNPGLSGEGRDVVGAIALLREARAISPENHWKLDIERDLSFALRAAGELDEAVAIARSALDRAPADLSLTDLGLLHGNLADLLAGRELAEAERHFQEAIRLLGDEPEGHLVHTRYADMLLRRGDVAEARDVLTRLFARVDTLRRVDDIAARRALSAAHARLGDLEEAEAATRRALDAAAGTPWEAVVRVESAIHRAEADEVRELALRYLRGECPASPATDEHFEDLLANRAIPLDEPMLEVAIPWARITRRRLLEARLLDGAGRVDDALEILNAAVETGDATERLRALVLRVAVLPESAVAERRADIEAIELQVGDPLTLPGTSLCDLAAACGLATAGEPGWATRAVWYAQNAFVASEGLGWRGHAARTWIRVVRDRVKLDGAASTAACCGSVRAVLPAVAALEAGRARLAIELVACLLLAGPLTLPERVDVALAVLDRLADGPDVRALRARALSIRKAASEAGTRVVPMPSSLNATTPFDDAPPAWLVDVIVRGERHVPPDEACENPIEIAIAARVRPDRADVLLATLLSAAAEGDEFSAICEVAAMCVNEANQGAGAWPELRKAVSQLPESGDPSERALRRALSFATRAEDPTGDTERELADQPAEPEDDRAVFDKAIASMHAAHEARSPGEASQYKASAIELLNKVLGKWRGSPQEADALVSLGNAHRIEPEADRDRAVGFYARADQIAGTGDNLKGKLHKVWADALMESGGEPNVRAAWEHIQLALGHRRSGYLRAETLLTASRIAGLHPDRSEAERVMGAARLLAEAAQVDARVSEQTLPVLLERLARWSRLRESQPERSAILDALGQIYPHRQQDIERARLGAAEGPAGMPRSHARQAAELLADPNFLAYMPVSIALLPPHVLKDKLASMPDRLRARVSAEDPTEGPTPDNSTEGLAGQLAALDEEQGAGAAGRAVGRFLLCVELARRGRLTLAEVRTALGHAREGLSSMGVSRAFRCHALVVMADALSPVDTVSDPVTDFVAAVELATEAVALEGGESDASRDALSTLGRALRYRTTGSRADDLREARRLFERCVELDRSEGHGEALAIDLARLSEVDEFLGVGDEESRLERVIQQEREAYAVAESRSARSLLASNIAWSLTLRGGRQPDEQAVDTFREALDWYARAREDWTPGDPDSVDNNETVCRADLALAEGRPDAAAEIWRQRLAALRARSAHPLDAAEAEHNLAEMLYRSRDADEIDEAIDLYRQALRHRTLTADPRKHWQSCLGLGRALLRRIELEEVADRLFDEAAVALRGAIVAARVLGPGRELAWSAKELGRLSLHGTDSRKVGALADEAWTTLREATPYLLLHVGSRLEEAMLAEQVAYRIANHAAEEGVLAPLPGGTALGRRASERVVRWLLRVEAPYQRTLLALFRLPTAVPRSESMAWRDAVARRDVHAVVTGLAAIHAHDPSWLRDDPSLEETRRWLRATPGSLALALRPGQGGVLVTLLDADPTRTAVLMLRGPIPEITEAQLALVLGDDARRAHALETLCEWAEQVFIARIRDFLGGIPKRVLWVPQGILRLLPPARLLPGAIVAVSASLALRAPHTVRPRPTSAVVIVADPGRGRRGLGEEAIAGARRLAAALGGGRLVLGVGSRTGSSVSPDALPGGPTASRVLRELDDAGVAVIVAHGHTEGVDDAWIELLAPDGSAERLDVAALLRAPGAIAGLSVVLLSCETGRADGAPDRPGGVAGALLQAGAREVVAPLWPVSLATALAVGEAVCKARAEGRDLAEALATLAALPGADGPTLGRVSPERRAAAAWDASAFVIWVG